MLVITLANKGNLPVHADPIDPFLYDPVREANTTADALLAYLDTGTTPKSPHLFSQSRGVRGFARASNNQNQ